MIIKFKPVSDTGEWLLFDNCSELRFNTTWTEVTGDHPDWYDLFGTANELHAYVSMPDDEGEPHRLVRWVRWLAPTVDGLRAHLLVTDGDPVFILNDEGETIDRV